MQYIIWAGLPEEYRGLYEETKKEFRSIAFKSISNAKVPIKKKLYLAAACFFPVWVAKLTAIRKARKFKADKMK